jgi:8-oxo-dGTP diphosphatase
MKIRPAILIIENGCVLTMQYRYGNEDVFNLPGGNLELFETIEHTLERELTEELGIKVAVQELVMVGEVIFKEQKKSTLHIIHRGKIISGEPILNPAETSALNICWLPIEELSGINMYPNVAKQINVLHANALPNPYIGQIEQQWF